MQATLGFVAMLGGLLLGCRALWLQDGQQPLGRSYYLTAYAAVVGIVGGFVTLLRAFLA